MNTTLSCCRIEIDDDLIDKAKALLKDDSTILLDKAKLFSLLGNDVRLKIVRLFLCYEKMCVCDLADVLEMKQSPISQHLRKLKDGGILENKRDGMTIFYFLKEDMRDTLLKTIEG
ncbi:MAG: transcriptional regulator [Arcobacter sp.]|nr:MAG: transcriptional regulator [Arcobacter sp.]